MLVAALCACVDPTVAGSGDSRPPDTAGEDNATAPTGDSIDDPVPVDDPTGTTPMSDALDPVGDVDWYSIELDEGDFLQVQTVTVEGDPSGTGFDCNSLTDTNPTDPVALVYDPEGTQIVAIDAWSGYACGGDGIGLVRADRAGTWTVAVTDWNNWEDGGASFGNPPVGGPEYRYRLYVSLPSAGAHGGELGATGALATLAQNGQVDSWSVVADERSWVTLFHATNTNANFDDLVLELFDSEGTPVARTDTDAFYGVYGGLSMRYPVDSGTYTLQIHDGDGVASPDDWYWLWRSDDTDHADNPEVEPNDDPSIATPLHTHAGSGAYASDYVVAGFNGVATDGDADAFSIEVSDGQYLYLSLYTNQVGSALAPQIALTDVDGTTVLAQADGDSPYLNGEPIRADGTATLTISGDGGSAEGYYLGYLERWDSRRPW